MGSFKMGNKLLIVTHYWKNSQYDSRAPFRRSGGGITNYTVMLCEYLKEFLI